MGLFDKFKKEVKIDDEEVAKYSLDCYVIKDNYKSKEYYLKQLHQINQSLNKFKTMLQNVEGYNACYYALLKFIFQKISILYVLGAEFDTIKQNVEDYRNIIEKLSNFCTLPYNHTVYLLSLGYLYNINVDKLKFVQAKMIDEKYVDAILDILRNKIFENKVLTNKDYYLKEKGYFGDEFDKDNSGLMNSINSNNTESKNQEFKKYLDEVKTKHYNRLLKEYEKVEEGQYTYLGSFDFKLTALAKILDIDKELIKDSKFIALDLL